jgi:hypothetical protein
MTLLFLPRSFHLSLRVCQGLGADFRRKSEIRKPALEARKRQALSRPTYFFCGSSNFSPFLNTAKIACEGQASRQRRQLSRQRDESNL